MADRFIADILSDGAPMVASARYTDRLFQPPSAAAGAPLGAASSPQSYGSVPSDGTKPRTLSSFAQLREHERRLRGENDDDDSSTDGDRNTERATDSDRRTKAPELMLESEDQIAAMLRVQVASMLRFALLFINFTFIVASLLMTLAGAITVNTPSLSICEKCQRLALAPVVLGLLMWFSGLFAFYWIKQRTVVFLLLHAGIVMFVCVGTAVIIITGFVFNGSINRLTEDDLLRAWERRMPNVSATIESPLCVLQNRNNCSGVHFGCCAPGACYNASDAPPAWVGLVCPRCAAPPVPTMCAWSVLQATTSADMTGFVVVVMLSFVLTITGMGLAMFVRRINNAT